MSRSFLILIIVMSAWISILSGCKSDPYCQTAISNLRAEKIQMENQYYELKAMYESDMSRMGQPAYSTNSRPVTSGFMQGSIIYNGTGSIAGGGISGGTVSDMYTPTLPSNPDAVMASHIQSVEVNQLAARANEITRLLIRPLDDQGAIMPVAGDLKIRLFDPASGNTLFENEYSASQVTQWIIDQPGQQPGIHVPIPLGNLKNLSDRLVCDLQYRTADNRILKHRTELVFSDARSPEAGPGRSGNDGQDPKSSSPIVPDDLDGALDIEIGDESNFDSLDDGVTQSSPRWRPDR